MLREFFSGISLTVEDLLLLESFQIKYLPERVPQDEFSILIQKYPFISQFLILKEPTVEEFINSLLQENNMISDEDLTITPVGRLCRTNVLKVPRAMGLLAPGSAWDVPEKIQIKAQREQDSLTYEFVSQDYSQVIVPNEGQAGGVTALCEVIGSARLDGTVRGEKVTMSGRGVLELVR